MHACQLLPSSVHLVNYDYDQPWVDRLCPGLCRWRPYALYSDEGLNPFGEQGEFSHHVILQWCWSRGFP